MSDERDYQARLQSELRVFGDNEDVHDLPSSFSYLTNTHLAPLLKQVFGYASYEEMIVHYVDSHPSERDELRVISLGSGNCDLELEVAGLCRRRCRFTCYELNPEMIERARTAAAGQGLLDRFEFVVGDINALALSDTFDVVLANHSLHHFVALEHIFAEVARCMEPASVFLINDMIGRNGHLFWGASLDLCNRLWSVLPKPLKYNHLLQRRFARREQFDCAKDSFEGVRAQDILPLLDQTFAFKDFAPFFALASRFVDRDYGSNFDTTDPLHRSLLDAIWNLDDFALRSKALKPTQMLAALVRKDAPLETRRHLYFETPAEAYALDDSACYETFDFPGGVDTVPLGTTLGFGRAGGGNRYKLSGWREAEERASWSVGQAATLELPFEGCAEPVSLVARCSAFLAPGVLDQQTVHVTVNDHRCATWIFRDTATEERFASIPADVLAQGGHVTVVFETPDASAPASLGAGADTDALGLALVELTFSPLRPSVGV